MVSKVPSGHLKFASYMYIGTVYLPVQPDVACGLIFEPKTHKYSSVLGVQSTIKLNKSMIKVNVRVTSVL